MISDKLLEEIDAYVAYQRQESRLLNMARGGALSADAVGRYLANIHYLISQTPAHLRRGEELALSLGRPQLADYFARKLEEETGHERWAEADMDAVGKLAGRAVMRRPTEAMRALVRNVERAIEQEPLLYLAYALFAEYQTVRLGPEWVAALEQRCGVPSTALTVATHHIDLDRDHVKEGCIEIDELAADERCHPAMIAMVRKSMQYFTSFCDDLCDADDVAA
jgi:pyrroloquinoline quinone (PQQ) biosynthesis protein C